MKSNGAKMYESSIAKNNKIKLIQYNLIFVEIICKSKLTNSLNTKNVGIKNVLRDVTQFYDTTIKKFMNSYTI